MASTRSSGKVAALSVTVARRAGTMSSRRRMRGSVTATAATLTYGCATGAFPDIEDMRAMSVQHGVPRRRHDGVGQRLSLVGHHPGLDPGAARETQDGDETQAQTFHDQSSVT